MFVSHQAATNAISVTSNVPVSSVVKAEVQLQWCEWQKYQLYETENSSSLTGELDALPYCQTFTNSVKLITISKYFFLMT